MSGLNPPRRWRVFPIIVASVVTLIYVSIVLYTFTWAIIDIVDASGDHGSRLAAIWFCLDLWGFIGSASLGGLAFTSWRNSTKFTVGGLCLGMMAGRMFAYMLVPTGFQMLAIWFILLVPVFYVVVGLITLLVAIMGGALLAVFFTGIPVLLFKQIQAIDKGIKVYSHQTNGLSGYVGRFLRWIQNTPSEQPLPDDSKGARFAEESEIEAMRNTGPKSIIAAYVTMPTGTLWQTLSLVTEKHILLMASTRSGKGTTVIIPHLLCYEGSAFVLDPKAENAKASYRRRRALNYSVHVMDPFGISGLPKSRFNPLSRFTPENAEAESKALAAALFIEDVDQDHWTRAGQQLVALFIMFVYYERTVIKDHQRDLGSVRFNLLANVKPALEMMMKMTEADGLIAALSSSFFLIPEREFGSVVSSAQRQTAILDNPHIKASLAASGPGEEIDFSLYKTRTMTVFLCLSAPMFPVFNRWLRLILTSAMDEMTRVIKPPPLPVAFILDEVATLRRMPVIENAVALSAGYGVQLITVWQDIAQMRDAYKDRWESFIGNSGIKIVFNLDDYGSAEYWSKSLGNSLVETFGGKLDAYGMKEGGNSVSEVQRPLMAPEEMMIEMSGNDVLVMVQGKHPVVARRINYYDNTNWNGLWDDPRLPPVPLVQMTVTPQGHPITPSPPLGSSSSPPQSARERRRARDAGKPDLSMSSKPIATTPSPWDNGPSSF